MGNNREKITRKYPNGSTEIETGYMSGDDFVYHSFDDEPAIIFKNGSKEWYRHNLRHRDNDEPAIIYETGTKKWYEHGEHYWVIENQRYNTYDEIHQKYKDMIIKTKHNISQKLTDMYINYVYIGQTMPLWLNKNFYCFEYVILNDTDRNEVILRYG